MLPNKEIQTELRTSYGKFMFWFIASILVILFLIKILSPFIVDYFLRKEI
jgi:hypothetical protein